MQQVATAHFSAVERKRQIPAAEETDPRNPYHHPWSRVVAKTPQQQRGLRVLGVLGGFWPVSGCSGRNRPAFGVFGGGYRVVLPATLRRRARWVCLRLWMTAAMSAASVWVVRPNTRQDALLKLPLF